MVRDRVMLLGVLILGACGGGDKKVTKPVAKPVIKAPPPPVETEEDREKKRHEAAIAIVPEGTCLPISLKDPKAPRLELAAIGIDAVVCAIDTDKSRLLGPVACWKIDLTTEGLIYQLPAPLPGRGIDVGLDDRCARGYCLPKDAKPPADAIAHMVWSPDSSKVAVLVGDDVHIYDASSKAHESSFSIRADKGVTGKPTEIDWVAKTIFVVGGDQGNVWPFNSDGTTTGPLEGMGAGSKPLSTIGGSFSLLDKNRVAIAEQGFSTLTTYEVDSGKRAKLVRKVGKPSCKADELAAYWKDPSSATGKCKDSADKVFGHLVGATAVAGKQNLLVLLRGPRLGQLGVLDAKTLAERKVIKLEWCNKD